MKLSGSWNKKAVATVLAVLLFGGEVSAQEPPFSQASLFNPKYWDAAAEGQVDEVEPATGNLSIRHKEIVIPGNGGLNIEVWRRYSLDSMSTGLSSTYKRSFEWAVLGPGWRMQAAPRLMNTSNYDVASGSISWSQDTFSLLCNGTAMYPGWAQNKMMLVLPDGSEQEVYWNPGAAGYTKTNWRVTCTSGNIFVHSPDGLQYEFGNISTARKIGMEYSMPLFYVTDEGGTVQLPALTQVYMDPVRVVDPWGNWLSFQYHQFGTPIEPWWRPGFPGTAQPPIIYSSTDAAVESPSSRISSITSSDGRSVQFTYDATTGRLTTITDGAGRQWSYEYLQPDSQSSRVLRKVIRPDSTAWEYDYYPGAYLTVEPINTISPLNNANISARRLRGLKYPFGGTTQYTYEHFNLSLWISGNFRAARGERVKTKTLPGGGTQTYAYTRGGAGQYDITQVSDSRGVTTYESMGPGFNIRNTISGSGAQNNLWRIGRLMKVTYPDGATETNVWQAREIAATDATLHELGWVRDEKIWVADLSQRTIVRDGATYVTAYSGHDAYGNPGTVVETGPNATRTTTRTYFNDPTKWIVGRLKDELSTAGTVARVYDTNGKVLSLATNGVTTSYTHDSAGNLASATLPASTARTFSNYKRGVPRTEIVPEGVTISRTVDDAGNVTSVTNGENRTTGYSYDGLGRVTAIDYPRGNDATVTYTANSQATMRGALVEKTEYDGFGRVEKVTLGGIATSYTHDAFGRMTFQSNPGSSSGTSYQYDAHNRLKRTTHTDTNYRTFDYSGTTITIRDERGNNWVYNYRAYGQLDTRFLMSVVAPDTAANVTIGRGTDDLVSSVLQAGVSRSFGYDSRKYLTSEVHPETGTTTYERDNAGNMTARIVGTARTDFIYDDLDRLTSTTYSDGTPSVTMAYTKTNRLSSVASSVATRQFGYDANDNLTAESLTVDSIAIGAQYGYTGNDQLASTVYPVSGRTVSYSPDVLGRPTQVSGYVNLVQYWPSGLPQQIDYANGTVTTYEQNSRLWPSSFATRSGASYLLSTNYGYDGAGNLLSISDAISGAQSRILGYDVLNRLTSAAGPWGSGSLGYDGAGNITSQALGSFNLSYAYGLQNRLNGVSGAKSASYSYDAYGNLSGDGSATYAYNGVPNLRCVNCASANKVEYRYDGLSKRVSVVKGGVTTYEFHTSDGQLLAEYVPADSHRLTEYIYLAGKRVAQRNSDQKPATAVTPARTSIAVNRNNGATLTVNVGGTNPTGTVRFVENGVVIGFANVINGQASIDVLGMALGSHSITAIYSGDWLNSANTAVFTVKVVNLSWLPAVLDIILN